MTGTSSSIHLNGSKLGFERTYLKTDSSHNLLTDRLMFAVKAWLVCIESLACFLDKSFSVFRRSISWFICIQSKLSQHLARLVKLIR